MRRIEAVDASEAQWEAVAAYVLALVQKGERSPAYSYLKVPADLLQPTTKLIADMNCEDCFTIISPAEDFPTPSPPPQILLRDAGQISLTWQRAIHAVFGRLRTVI